MIHCTFAVDFDPEVLILLTENHGTINKIAHYLHMYGLAQPEPSLPCFVPFGLFVISMTRQIQIVRREIGIPLQLNYCPVGEVFHNRAIKCFFFFFVFFLLEV